jgi:hypothetical protein
MAGASHAKALGWEDTWNKGRPGVDHSHEVQRAGNEVTSDPISEALKAVGKSLVLRVMGSHWKPKANE